MSKKTLLLTVFIIVVVAQLFVPAKMIMNREKVLSSGTVFKFITAPIDPTDPFRGKYVLLDFEEQNLEVSDGEYWKVGESMFVTLIKDDHGFATIHNPSKVKPAEGQDYLKVKVRNSLGGEFNQVTIDFPFDRLYLEESKADEAEQTYRESQLDSAQSTYALVYVKEGEAVLSDLLINEVSIKDIVKAQQEKNKE